VGFPTVILQVQLIMDIMHEGQTIWDESVVDHDEVNSPELRAQCGDPGEEPGEGEETYHG